MSDRQYKHQGYMDGNHGRNRSSKGSNNNNNRSRSPKDPMLEDAPRGRSASSPEEEVFRCAGCGEILTDYDQLTDETICPRCETDLHTCTHCKHFDTSSRFQCRQPVSESISPKDKRNDCEYFKPRTVLGTGGRRRSSLLTGQPTKKDDAKAAFERLFKK